jgi:hypothetical protein
MSWRRRASPSTSGSAVRVWAGGSRDSPVPARRLMVADPVEPAAGGGCIPQGGLVVVAAGGQVARGLGRISTALPQRCGQKRMEPATLLVLSDTAWLEVRAAPGHSASSAPDRARPAGHTLPRARRNTRTTSAASRLGHADRSTGGGRPASCELGPGQPSRRLLSAGVSLPSVRPYRLRKQPIIAATTCSLGRQACRRSGSTRLTPLGAAALTRSPSASTSTRRAVLRN